MNPNRTEKAINFAAIKLGIVPEDIRKEQKSAVVGVLDKRDVVVCLPTGFGKSFIYQSAPLAVDYLNSTTLEDHDASSNSVNTTLGNVTNDIITNVSIAIVISPLTSLIKEQVSFLTNKGLKAIYFGDICSGTVKEVVERGIYNYIFMSPEQLLGTDGITLLRRSVYHKRLCGIFIDESHCDAKWGVGSAKVKAFRSYNGKLNEVRSHLPRHIPFMALTATASLTVRKTIEEKMNLYNPLTILKSPEKVNIRYSVVKLQGQDIESFFSGIIEELVEREDDMERIIVFCRSHKNCREMYSKISFAHPNIKKFIAMYHSTTEESVKEKVIKSFADEQGVIRILFATIAFGMGVNVKGVNNIIHIGPPLDLDDYLQESGRAGRNGSQSHAILINYSGCSGLFKTAESMKQYMKNEGVCRRRQILEPFGYAPSNDNNRPRHYCCDICAAQCLCRGDICSDNFHGRGLIERKLYDQLSQVNLLEENKKVVRTITEENKNLLHEQLIDFRSKQLGEAGKLLTGDDVASGLPQSTVNNIMAEIVFISDTNYLKENFLFLNPAHAEQVMHYITNYTDSVGSSEHVTSTAVAVHGVEEDSSGSESENLYDYRHLNIAYDSSEESDN